MVYPFAHTNPCPGAFQNAEVAQTRKIGSGEDLVEGLLSPISPLFTTWTHPPLAIYR
jgi:hypothetical protein